MRSEPIKCVLLILRRIVVSPRRVEVMKINNPRSPVKIIVIIVRKHIIESERAV